MNFCKSITYTAGVISDYEGIVDTTETEEPYDWGKSIIENVSNNKYVDVVDTLSAKSVALRSWYYDKGGIDNDTRIPYTNRFGLFGLHAGGGAGFHNGATGAATYKTFRPAIWN